MKFGLTATRWLKGVHLFFAGTWVGAAIGMIVISLFKHRAVEAGQLYAINLGIKIIDDYVIIPVAFGSLLTGLLYSLFTKWGFFKHGWMIFKWVATVAAILFGTFFLGPWVNEMTAISKSQGLTALSDARYLASQSLNFWWGLLQVTVLVVMIFLSIFKPWPQKKRS